MKGQLDLLRRALAREDRELGAVRLPFAASLPIPEPESPPREGALTWERFLSEMRGRAFAKLKPDERAARRRGAIAALESPQAEVPLPERLRLHEILTELYLRDDPFARTQLLAALDRVPLVYGPWRAMKRIFKRTEETLDIEAWGLLAARFDAQLARGPHGHGGPCCEISHATLAYLARRGWRLLRRLGQGFTAIYPDAVCSLLANYPDDTVWQNTWIANHIFFHAAHTKAKPLYDATKFFGHRQLRNPVTHRAFPEAWKRSPRPLLNLLAAARSEMARKFAIELLKTEFRSVLREFEPSWVAGLAGTDSPAAHEFFVWMLNNVSRFEQAKLRELGLHEAVLKLFDSRSETAVQFAADYARTHARDLPTEELIRLEDLGRDALSKLALDLLSARHPVKDVGLDGWGKLLETRGRGHQRGKDSDGHKLAAEMLRKHFGASDLTPAWFQDRLASAAPAARRFAQAQLPKLHSLKQLGASWLTAILDRLEGAARNAGNPDEGEIAAWVLGELGKLPLDDLGADDLSKLLLNPLTSAAAADWIDQGKVKPAKVPLPTWKALAFEPDWDASETIAALRTGPRLWMQALTFGRPLAERVLGWLRDVRKFAPADLGKEWLLRLLEVSDAKYNEFAADVLIRGFVPADFAPETTAPAAEAAADGGAVDLGGASFLFTGKLATMDRNGAEDKVRAANGTNASGVTPKLQYLVIGDEGSPLYGAGRKGSKQLKAEELIAKGAATKIISETAFLQMLAGRKVEVGGDRAKAGCAALWELACGPLKEDDPKAVFARKYVLRHHPEICLAETDRPVDPGAEILPEFLTFEQVRPLFADGRRGVRDLALKLALWEFARWAPPMGELVKLCELPHGEVRQFVTKALTADAGPEHKRYRVDPAILTADAVYAFCESREDAVRSLGMQLIQANPRLQVPDELFRLTESPDRVMRAFVIRILWGLYRERGTTENWKPSPLPISTIGLKNKKGAEQRVPDRGPGSPTVPERPPADQAAMREFLRRTLFEIPPARLAKTDKEGVELRKRLRPLPSRKAKLALIEVLRDLGLEDLELARTAYPLFREFRGSQGLSEFSACMVALSRLRERHGAALDATAADSEGSAAARDSGSSTKAAKKRRPGEGQR